jgi:hypothetical protein
MEVVGEVFLLIGCGLVLCSTLIWLWSLRPERAPWRGQDVDITEGVNENERFKITEGLVGTNRNNKRLEQWCGLRVVK